MPQFEKYHSLLCKKKAFFLKIKKMLFFYGA